MGATGLDRVVVMGTVVSFHAHPDDESIGTAGTLARAADAGHRVVLVFATRGELGKPVPGSLAEGEQLSLRRSAECFASAEILGASRVEFLGYTDSGMMGEPTNDAPYCFWRAPVEHAARRLSVILDEEEPDVLTVYDDEGGYGHPDHIQVHPLRCGRPSAAPSRSWRSTPSTGSGWSGGCAGSSRPGRSTGRRGCPRRPRRAGASRNA
jgi:GlcNAc-PI de-N-acetylase